MSKIGFRAWNVPRFAVELVQSASRPDLSQGRTLSGAGLDWELNLARSINIEQLGIPSLEL